MPFDTQIDVTISLVFLILGLTLNFLITIIIILNHSMHESSSCYILSFVLSNLILLLDTLRNILKWWYNTDLIFNMQYIINLTFNASILTLQMFTIDRYVFIHKQLSANDFILNTILQLKTAAKGVVIIWIMTSMITAMELHLYSKFERDSEYVHSVDPKIQIFTIFTFIFTGIPIILIFCLGGLLIYELEQLRVTGGVTKKDKDGLRLLAGVAVGFLFTMVPYKVALILNHTFPIICCSNGNLEIYLTIIKGSILVFPLTCFATSNHIRTVFKNTFLYCRWNLKEPKKNLTKTRMSDKD